MTDKIIVFSTCDSEESAGTLARALVERRVAACVNILPAIRSFYWWHDKIQDDDEWMLLIKSTRGKFEELRKAIEELHSYDVPEVVALPIVDGAEPYLEWLEKSVE